MSENWFMRGTLDWASQLRHFKKGNYPSWKILAHARVKITAWTGERCLRGCCVQGEWNPFLSLVRARARASSCASCAVGLGWLRADSLLRVCGGGVWRPLSFASGVGQGRLGVAGCLDGPPLSTFPSLIPPNI